MSIAGAGVACNTIQYNTFLLSILFESVSSNCREYVLNLQNKTITNTPTENAEHLVIPQFVKVKIECLDNTVN